MLPLVSINLCCYNSQEFLSETLESIFAQTFTAWELVIVNDGSSDGTESIIRRHIDEGRRIVYHHQANTGLGASRNKALELSSGKYIALIDHDDVWDPRKLELQVRQLEADERIALSYSDTDVVDARGRVTRTYMIPDLTAEGHVLTQLFLRDFIACSSVLMRRAAVTEVGVFRPELRITEEYDLFLRLAERYPFGRISEPLLKLRAHAGNASWNFLRTREENRVVLSDLIRRRPLIRESLGSGALRVRLAGFSCTPGEASFLRAPFRALRGALRGGVIRVLNDSIRASLKVLMALLPDSIVDRLLLFISWRRRKAVLVSSE